MTASAKTTGLGGIVQVADSSSSLQTITNDVTNYTFSTPRAVQDVTGVDKSAHERLLLLADFSVTLNGVFDFASTWSHAVFSTVPSSSVIREVLLTLTSSGSSPTLQCNTLFSDYSITRANTGELTWSAPGALADGSVPTWSAA